MGFVRRSSLLALLAASCLALSAACGDDASSSTGAGGAGSTSVATTGAGAGKPEPVMFEVVPGSPLAGPDADVIATATFDGYATAAAASDALVAAGTTLGVIELGAMGATPLPLVGNEPNLPAEVGLVRAMVPFEGGALVASDTGLYVAKDGIVTRSAGHAELDPLGLRAITARHVDDDGDGAPDTTLALATDDGLYLWTPGSLERWSVEGEEGAPSAAFATKTAIYVAWGERLYAIDRAEKTGTPVEHPLGAVRAIACSTLACGEGAVVYFATSRGLVERSDDGKHTLYTLANDGESEIAVEGFAFDGERQRLFAVTASEVVRARTAGVPVHVAPRTPSTFPARLTTDKLGDLWVLSGSEATKLATGTPLSFATDVQPIMAAYCSTCHGEGKKGAPKLELESYEVMKDFVGTALTRIQDGSMPPSGYPALPPEPLQILLDWSESKAP